MEAEVAYENLSTDTFDMVPLLQPNTAVGWVRVYALPVRDQPDCQFA